jgi:hypothetical protein
MKQSIRAIAALLLISVTIVTVALAVTSGAVTCDTTSACVSEGLQQAGSSGDATELPAFIQNIINILLFDVGSSSYLSC